MVPLAFLFLLLVCGPAAENEQKEDGVKANGAIPASFDLSDLKKRTFDFFWEEADPTTGLVEDRAPDRTFCSIAQRVLGLLHGSSVRRTGSSPATRQQKEC